MNITIFLADDHAVIRDGLRALLDTQPDMQVIGDAANGREAVRQTIQHCPDIVIMDIAMPELNGIEATVQLQEHCPSTQVIILSMHAATEHVVRALQAGARGYLLKESAGAEVVDAIHTVFAGQRHLSQKLSNELIDDYLLQRQLNPIEDPLAGLSPREREILQLVVEGKSSADIATILSLSPHTIDTYRSRLMQKLKINDLSGLVRFAIKHGLISLE